MSTHTSNRQTSGMVMLWEIREEKIKAKHDCSGEGREGGRQNRQAEL